MKDDKMQKQKKGKKHNIMIEGLIGKKSKLN